MRVPLRWLGDYVDVAPPDIDLARLLTASGTEVERIDRVGAGWDHIVVGRITAIEPVPRTERLLLTRVDVGNRSVQIVTGATNVATGNVVPVALPGAKLRNGEQEIEIQPRTFSGVPSEGMLCSGRELGISDDASGIHILPNGPNPGTPLHDLLGGVMFDLAITPNRSDCLSMLGIAREVAALTEQRVRLPNCTVVEHGVPIAEQLSVTIDDPDLCPRYVARLIEGVAIGPSPEWLVRRLLTAGLPVISNVVDVTNYVMWELGQPLHAFDADCLAGNQIVVRRARAGEQIVTIDNKERVLTDDMLVIADRDRPVGLAGVMGGLNSEITDTTTRIVIESANFEPRCIRRTKRALDLPSEASRRFERGVDRTGAARAAARAAHLMLSVAGGRVAAGALDVYPSPPEPVTVDLTEHDMEALLGTHIPVDEAANTLRALAFGVDLVEESRGIAGNGHHAPATPRLSVTPPSWRLDVAEVPDLIEEIARMRGYDTIPEAMPSGAVPSAGRNPWLEFEDDLRNALTGCGINEIVSYSLTSKERMRRLFGPVTAEPLGPSFPASPLPSLRPDHLSASIDEAVTIQNPLSIEHASLRVTMMETTLATIDLHRRRGEQQIRLFELGRAYVSRGDHLPIERRTLSIGLAGLRERPGWNHGTPPSTDFFDAKGVVDEALGRFSVRDVRYEPALHPVLHPGRAAYVVHNGHRIGVVGEVHPEVLRRFEIPDGRVCLAELDLELLHTHAVPRRLDALPRFPAVHQDIALVVDDATPAASVADALYEAGAPLVVEAHLFDVYRGTQLPFGKKSLAFTVMFQAKDRTLTSAEVAAARDSLLLNMERRHGATLRG